MKKLLGLMGALLLSTPAFAGMDGGVNLTSDYLWRGVSQTQGNTAVQWDLQADKKGFYAGTWGSQVDFGTDASIEYDFYGGYAWSKGDVAIDVGIIQYNYNTELDSSEEWYAIGTYKFVSVGYYQDRDDTAKDYMEASIAVPFIDIADVSIRYGEFADESSYNQITVSKELEKGFTVGLEIVSEESVEIDLKDRVALSLGYRF